MYISKDYPTWKIGAGSNEARQNYNVLQLLLRCDGRLVVVIC